jgi:uncharacterized protein (UPF0335 family)
MSTNNQRLLSIVQRIERLEEEKRALSADISDIKQEAKSAGFDVKVINQMIRERRLSDAEREEQLALAEIYRAALGMLNDTPLGDHARKRFDESMRKPADPPTDAPGNGANDPAEGGQKRQEETKPKPSEAVAPVITEKEIADARTAGSQAQMDGVSIIRNPHPFGDPRRAAWDEGFCASAGHDGMEIPDAWRRKPKAKQTDSKDNAK